MSDIKEKVDAIQLDYQDRKRSVVVSPENQDRFVMTCERAIEACRLSESRNIFKSDIEKMVLHCQEWALAHAKSIRAIYVGPQEFHVIAFVVPVSDHFDFDLAEKVAELAHELTKKFPAARPDAIEVPGASADNLQRFVNLEEALLIYGTPVEASASMGS